jgi:enoyl-CoA hydratase/carnithine racemase
MEHITSRTDCLLVESRKDGIVVVTLNRPARLNALTFEMFGEIERLCSTLEGDPSNRVMILTGAGRGFCAGLDLDCVSDLAAMSPQEMLQGQEHWARSVTALRSIGIPVIAAVNGPAAGAGLSLALAADFRIASEKAQFNAAFVRIGLSGGDLGTSWALPRIVGLGHAYEFLLTGASIDSDEALRIGLVNHLFSAETLMKEVINLAKNIVKNSPWGVRLTKQVIQQNVDATSLQAAIELENRNQVLATRTHDMTEALSAFREKREPTFTND